MQDLIQGTSRFTSCWCMRVQTYWAGYLRSGHFTVCNFYFNEEKSYNNLLKKTMILLSAKSETPQFRLHQCFRNDGEKENHWQSLLSLHVCIYAASLSSVLMTYFIRRNKVLKMIQGRTASRETLLDFVFLCTSSREWDW